MCGEWGIRQKGGFMRVVYNIIVLNPGEIGELSGNYASSLVCEPSQDDVHILFWCILWLIVKNIQISFNILDIVMIFHAIKSIDTL